MIVASLTSWTIDMIFRKWKSLGSFLLVALLIETMCRAQEEKKPYKFLGDFRFRSEFDTNRDNALPNRFRDRVRLRFGGNYRINDYFTVGGRLTTGDPEDPNSPYQTLGTVFKKTSFALDQAYVTFRLKTSPFWITGGKFAHPFQTPAIYKELVWDADVHPEGVAAGYGFNWTGAKAGLIAADYALVERNRDKDTFAAAAQIYFEVPRQPFSLLGAIGGYRYYNIDTDQTVFRDNAGNAGATQFQSDFAIIDVFLNVTYKRGRWPVAFNAQFIKNTEAKIAEDAGIAVGAALGETKSPGDIKLYYQYQLIEQDAVFSPFVQDDFLAQTNFKGHLFGLTWRLLEKTDLNLWGLISKQDSPSGKNWQNRLRADLTTSF